jgi:Mn2+/Fe2+ NRAMP family transporter
MAKNAATDNAGALRTPPVGLAILGMVGPSMIWCSEFIGSGEVILSPRAGAILGIGVLWVVVTTIFLKCWIGLSGARYTACTGEGMVDMFDRMPGPRHWAVWIVLVVQFIAATLSIGALAMASGNFLHHLLGVDAKICGAVAALFALWVAWTNAFDLLKIVMSLFVLIIIVSVLYIASRVFPGLHDLLYGLSFHVPPVPDWAVKQTGNANSWKEIIPLTGWAAGGFASQVWYTYWVIGANYGMTQDRGYGKPADVSALGNLTREAAQKIKGWCRVVYTDATVAMSVGIVVTGGFLIAGAGVLRPLEQAPQGKQVAEVLSQILSQNWGQVGRLIYLIAGSAALVGTLTGQLAGWPRLLADASRICIPAIGRNVPWKWQFRFFLGLFFLTNLTIVIIVYATNREPVSVIQLAAILDGVLLTALQAIWVAVGLYYVLPRILSKEAYQVLKPSWAFAVVLGVAAVVYGYLCIFQIPPAVVALFKSI